ncbi:MAG TPA: DMT family transporter [Terriglobia bacterium]|nr:DMT family transporter [Terriglobia bacterium]
MAKRPPVRGEVWALGSVLGYASGNVFDALAVTGGDPLVGPFLRGLPSLALGLGLMWKHGTWAELRPRSPRYIGRRAIMPFIWAGVLSTIGLFLYYFAIRAGGVILTVPLIETWVIWGTLAAWFMLGEELRGFLLIGWGVIALGLATLIFGQLQGHPLTAAWYWALPLAALAAMSYGVSGVLWRDGQLRGAHQSTAILLQFVSSVGVGLIGLAASGRGAVLFSTPPRNLLNFLGSGVFSGVIAIYCIFKALRLAPVARVYAVSSLTPLTATFFARVFLHQYLNLPMLLGVTLICAGVILTQLFRSRAEASAQAAREADQPTRAPREA